MSYRGVSHAIAIGGDVNVGKTSLVQRYCLRAFDLPHDPTLLEVDNGVVQVIDGQLRYILLHELDFEEYVAVWEQCIRASEACVLVYSITSRSSFESIKPLYHRIQKAKKSFATSPSSPDAQPPMPVMLVGNKCDMVAEREVSVDEGVALARELCCEVFETSAKTGHNVDEAIRETVRVLDRQKPPAPIPRDITNDDSDLGRRCQGRDKPRVKISTFKLLIAWLLERLESTPSLRKSRRMEPAAGYVGRGEAGSPQEANSTIGKAHYLEAGETESLLSGKLDTRHSSDSESTAA